MGFLFSTPKTIIMKTDTRILKTKFTKLMNMDGEVLKQNLSMAELPELTLSNLKIEPKEFGKGSFAFVHKAIDKTNNKQVAIRKINTNELRVINKDDKDGNIVNYVRRGIYMQSSLTHPSLLPVLGYKEQDGLIYALMDLMDGDVENLLKKVEKDHKMNEKL